MLLRAKCRLCGKVDVMIVEEASSTGDLGGTPWTLSLEDWGGGRLDESTSFEYADRADMPSLQRCQFLVPCSWPKHGSRVRLMSQ